MRCSVKDFYSYCVMSDDFWNCVHFGVEEVEELKESSAKEVGEFLYMTAIPFLIK